MIPFGSVCERMNLGNLKKSGPWTESRPVSVLHTRDVLQVLLDDWEDEESMLRDYVMGIGYR